MNASLYKWFEQSVRVRVLYLRSAPAMKLPGLLEMRTALFTAEFPQTSLITSTSSACMCLPRVFTYNTQNNISYPYNNIIYRFGVSKMCSFIILCSPRLHLFKKGTVKAVML